MWFSPMRPDGPPGDDGAMDVFVVERHMVGWTAGEVDALGEQLESRKIIDRAKGILIDECGMKESDAFTFIQRTAMSERSRMRDVAERVLDGSLRP